MFLSFFTAFSQDIELAKEDTTYQNLWMLGVGYNIVDDSGNFFDEPFNISDNWNALPYPSRISIGRYFNNGLGVEFIGSYNKYKEGKIIDKNVNTVETDYFALDGRLSYDLNKVIGQSNFFDPYIGAGMGYTEANNISRTTFNTTIGIRTWFTNRLGLDVNAVGKWSLNTTKSNHIQYGLGLVYKFNVKEGYTRKERTIELARVRRNREGEKRISDSLTIISDKVDKQTKAINEIIEKENIKLVSKEQLRLDKEEERKKLIEKAIKDLGNVYFDLNSSYLNTQSKEVLDKLALLLLSRSTIILKVKSYTDSRGTDKYNLWLSKRRVQRTVDYLIAKGIEVNRLLTEAYGEDGLTNECDNFTFCEEEKHQMNRRTEFSVVKF